MPELKSVCVYCGSSPGNDAIYMKTATAMGEELASHGIELVFGGGNVGLMGQIANAALAAGGRVRGIIPEFLRAVEMPSSNLHELVVTDTMHERKHDMYVRSDAFVVMPGGLGTLEEVVEMISWAQLRQHEKPIILLNVNGFWEPFVTLLDHIIEHGFARFDIRNCWQVVNTTEEVLPAIKAWLEGEDRRVSPKF